MKKALAIILALVAVAAFAQTPSVSADATLTWGFDLDNQTHGFENTYSADITIPFAVEDAEATGEGTYGYLSLSGVTFELFDDPTTGGDALGFNDEDADGYSASLEAKIVSGPFSVSIYSEPSLDLNYAAALLNGDVETLFDADMFGTTIGYDAETFGAGLIIMSADNMFLNVDNEYGMGLTVWADIVPELLSIDLAFSYDVMETDKDMGLSFSLPVTVAGLELTPSVDLDLTSGAAALYDVYVDVAYALEGGLSTGFGVYYSDLDDDLEATVFVESDSFGVANLYAYADFSYYNALETAPNVASWAMSANLNYTHNIDEDAGFYVMPYAAFSLDSAEVQTLNVGVEFAVIANTTFVVDFNVDDMNAVVPTDVLDSTTYNDKGDFTVSATISL